MMPPAEQRHTSAALHGADATNDLPDLPFILEENTTLSMHFDMDSIQSVMRKHDPAHLVLGYSRTIMGFLFFQPAPAHIAMIGLGGGSLAKYCTKILPDARFTAVEINPRVIALRDKFKVPRDSHLFSVLHADGAEYVSDQSERVDVLLIDGFNEAGHAAELCSAEFYDNCHAKLKDGGVLAVNLLTSDPAFDTYTSRIRRSFRDNLLVIEADTPGNAIAFACKGDTFPPPHAELMDSVLALGPRHPLPLHHAAPRIMQQYAQHFGHPALAQDTPHSFRSHLGAQ